MVIILPFAEKDGIFHYNSTLVIDANGKILGTYRKIHIPAYFTTDLKGGTGSFERLYFAPGNLGFPIFNTAFGRLGVQICYDRMYPEGYCSLALKGAEIVYNPTNYATYGLNYRVKAWGRLLIARAYENGFFVVAPNKAGVENGRNNVGRSLIISPIGGEILAEAQTEKDELIVAGVDLDDVIKAHRRLPFWCDRRPDQYKVLLY